MIKPEDVTIIIPHLGGTVEREYSLDQCLKSLKETVPDIRIIVVKNGNQCMNIHNHQDRIILYSQGQCKAVNAAIATVSTPWVFITNDDMVYPENWFERLTAPIVDGGTYAYNTCISPVLIEPRPGAPTFLTHFAGGAGGDFNMESFKEKVGELYLTVKPHLKNGFNFPVLIYKDLWDTIGGYDVNYDPWGSNSDSDLLYKIRLAGVQPIQQRACFVYHFSQTSGTFEPAQRSYWEKNFKYFQEKWGFERTDDHIWEADFPLPGRKQGRIFFPEWEGKYNDA